MSEPPGRHGCRDLAAYFCGRWSLHREITDDAGQPVGSFAGRAEFRVEDGVLIYHERGELELGAHRGPAERTLHYRITGPGQAEVHFDHGGFFHDLDLRSGHWEVDHPCRADLYRGEFDLDGPDRWRQRWHVSGPAKANVLTSRFERSG